MSKMYSQGRQIKTFNELIKILFNREYVFMFGKPLHPGWIFSLQFKTIIDQFNRKSIYIAKRNKVKK
jgi:hypothetical protein